MSDEEIKVDETTTTEEEKEPETAETSAEQESDPSCPQRGQRLPFVTSVKSSPFYAQASAILHWHDPVQSALLFGIGNFFFFLITYGDYTVLTLLSYLALALIFVCGAYVNGTLLRSHLKKEKAENPFATKLKNPYEASKYTLEPHADCIIGLINDVVFLWTSVLYFTDTMFSLKIAIFIWTLSVLGKLFSGITLLYMTFFDRFYLAENLPGEAGTDRLCL